MSSTIRRMTGTDKPHVMEMMRTFYASPAVWSNGSDEILNFAFMAYCDNEHPAAFPDISYGFYKVFAQLFQVAPKVIPLREDFSLPVEKFCGVGSMVVFANPNAPTAIALPLSEVEKIVASNPEHVVLVDEAYVDFGAKSALPLIEKYENLLVVQTFSKSRALAGARIGCAFGCEKIIKYLNDVKFSFNSYTMNQTSIAMGVACVQDDAYFKDTVGKVIATRERVKAELKNL